MHKNTERLYDSLPNATPALTGKDAVKFIKQMEKVNKEVEHLHKTGIPRCMTCKTNFVQETEYIWKPNCECFKNKNLKMSMG